MIELSVPRILVSSIQAGAGKSLITLGIAMALRARGLGVSCVVSKSAAAYASLLRRATGRTVRCIDSELLSIEERMEALYHAGFGADVLLIDGCSGMLDGDIPGALLNTDVELVLKAGLPVIAVSDLQNIGGSFVVIARGLEVTLDQYFGGIIGNRLNTAVRDKEYYDTALEAFGMRPLLGGIPNQPGIFEIDNQPLSQRRSGGLPTPQLFSNISSFVSDSLDLDQIMAIATSAPRSPLEISKEPPRSKCCRIAYTDDPCFCIGFQDNLDLLRHYGGELAAFSPIADGQLPRRIGGLYITGGFLHEYAEDLERNAALREAIRDFAQTGGAIFAEGGGAAYLFDRYRIPDISGSFMGVGLIPGEAVAVSGGTRRISRGILLEDSLLGKFGDPMTAVITDEWQASNAPKNIFTIRFDQPGHDSMLDGYSPQGQVVATFAFTHWGTSPSVAQQFIEAATLVYKRGAPQSS